IAKMSEWEDNQQNGGGWGAENQQESQPEAEGQQPKVVPETDVKSSIRILGELHIGENTQWVKKTAFNYETFAEPPEEIIQRTEWASSGRRYDWNEGYGEIATKDEELEKLLFGEVNHTCTGIEFTK